MPADRLTPDAQLVEQVEATLADQPSEPLEVNAVDPTQAVRTHRTAGRAAPQRRLERAWFHASITPVDWANAEATFASHVGPRLDHLDDRPARWWFLRKHPDWRLRVRTDDHDTIGACLDDLVSAGVIAGWRPGIYEPETAAFGGPTAMTIVHNLFCADSRGVLTYARQPTRALGRRELSLLLIRALQQHAGLDWFEAGDMFDRVAQLRPTPADAARVDTLATAMRPLLTVAVHADLPLFALHGPADYVAPWLAAHIHAGQQLGQAATGGQLERGLRAILTHIVIFHWNRLGLSAQSQGILAHAAKAAILPRS